MNTHPNESFLPSQQALSGIFGDIDAIQNSALAAIGYLGATTLNADPLTRSQFTQMLSNLSDVGASFLLPRISLTPGGAFGVTSVTPQSRVDSGTVLQGNLAEVWKQPPTVRGIAIESHLAATEYKDWFNIGQLNNGKFPLVDFQKGNQPQVC